MPQTITATWARNNFSDIMAQVAYNQQDFIIKKGNKPLAIISSIQKYQLNRQNKLQQLATSVIGSVNLDKHPQWKNETQISNWLKNTRSSWDRN